MSKFKAVYTRGIPEALDRYLESPEFAGKLLDDVLGKDLRVADPTGRPAEHYVQVADEMVEVKKGVWGIELTLSKVSVRDGRFFGGALEGMRSILTDAIERFVPQGNQVQIFCIIQTDTPVPGTASTLFEMESGIWVQGKA